MTDRAAWYICLVLSEQSPAFCDAVNMITLSLCGVRSFSGEDPRRPFSLLHISTNTSASTSNAATIVDCILMHSRMLPV